MTIREFFLENFAADLEYHPRRAVLYSCLAIGSLLFWFLSPREKKFVALPLVFALGSLPLFIKAIFLLRRSSEGLGLSHRELADLSGPTERKELPSIGAQASQVVQDFGAGPFLLWPILNLGRHIDHSWGNPPRLVIFVTGAALFLLGMVIRRMTAACRALGL